MPSQVGYIIRGGYVLDLMNTLSATENISQDHNSPDKDMRDFQTMVENSHDYDTDVSVSVGNNNDKSYKFLESNNNERVTSSQIEARKGTLSSCCNASKSRANSPTAATIPTATVGESGIALTSASLRGTAESTKNNYKQVFSSDIMILGKRIVWIGQSPCKKEEEMEREIAEDERSSTPAEIATILAAASINKESLTEKDILSANLASNGNNNPSAIAIRPSPIPAFLKNPSFFTETEESGIREKKKQHHSVNAVPSSLKSFLVSQEFLSGSNISSLNPFKHSSNAEGFSLSSFSDSGFSVNIFDASGCYVLPGLIDSHVHVYQYSTPLGIDIDEFCLKRGVTTAVDAGSSGASTFAGLRKFISERCVTRLLAFLHIASHGLASAGCSGFGKGGECDSLNQVDVDQCVSCVKNNRDLIVGVKVRLAKDVTDDGRNEEEVYREMEYSNCQSSIFHALI